MSKKSLSTLTTADLSGKKALVRADFNVPLDDQGNITDDTRIRAALPTIQYLSSNGAKVILCSHFGRPKGDDFASRLKDKFRLTPVASRLSELLNKPVVKTDDCIGEAVVAKVGEMQNGDVLLLENVRFHPEEEKTSQRLPNSWHRSLTYMLTMHLAQHTGLMLLQKASPIT